MAVGGKWWDDAHFGTGVDKEVMVIDGVNDIEKAVAVISSHFCRLQVLGETFPAHEQG